MASITLSVSDEFKEQLKQFSWINWSEIAKEETRKKIIFEKYMQTKTLSYEDWEFCEEKDWHPVDELPIKEEFKKKIKKIREEKGTKFSNISELRKIIEN